MEDYGWFGPGSVSWKVWSYPTGLTVGFSRAVVVEELDPFLIAPVKVSSKIYQQPKVRYDRTLRYFATCLFGDSRSIAKASEILTRVHARVAAPASPRPTPSRACSRIRTTPSSSSTST